MYWQGVVWCGEEIRIHTEKYDNGKVKKEYQYYTSYFFFKTKHGWYKPYYESGKVKEEGNYVEGKKEGKEVGYYESGKVKLEKNWKHGKQEGKWVFYDEEGNITDEDIWKDGECVEMCEGDEREMNKALTAPPSLDEENETTIWDTE